MVKRSRDQSQDAPRRFNWLTMAPPDSAFHAQTAREGFSRPSVAAARLLRLHQLALDHHLRGDAGVVGARLPQHVLAAHALEAAQNVLQRVVERMAHMQRAGDVRRRDDDAIGLARPPASGAPARNAPASIPGARNAPLDRRGVERLVHHVAASQRASQPIFRKSCRLFRSGYAPETTKQDGAGDPEKAEPPQRPPRATRSISARTSRSTMTGRLSSSQPLSIGRSISRTISSSSSFDGIMRVAAKA
jgi:hypothetical protein